MSLLKGSGWALLLTLAGCEPLPYENVGEDGVVLITRVHQDDPTNMEALIVGRLWIVDRCVTIGESADDSRTTIWRNGFRVGEDAEGMFVHHPARKDRFQIGDDVRFGGGYAETVTSKWVGDWVEGGDLRGCPGPFIFVDTTDG